MHERVFLPQAQVGLLQHCLQLSVPARRHLDHPAAAAVCALFEKIRFRPFCTAFHPQQKLSSVGEEVEWSLWGWLRNWPDICRARGTACAASSLHIPAGSHTITPADLTMQHVTASPATATWQVVVFPLGVLLHGQCLPNVCFPSNRTTTTGITFQHCCPPLLPTI